MDSRDVQKVDVFGIWAHFQKFRKQSFAMVFLFEEQLPFVAWKYMHIRTKIKGLKDISSILGNFKYTYIWLT